MTRGVGSIVVRVLVGVVVVAAVAMQRRSLLSAADRLGHLSPTWLALALAAELASFLAAAELYHHLLIGTGTRVDRLSLVALIYSGTAISATVPAGAAVSGGYMYRAFVRRGSSAGAAAWVLAATGVLSLVSLLLLGLVGAQIRGIGVICSAIGAGLGVSVVLIAAGLVCALVWSCRHQGRIELLALSVARWWTTAWRRARRQGAPRRAAINELGGLGRLAVGDAVNREVLGMARLGVALVLASANWLADLAALAVAFAALGFAVPWQGLVLAYAVTQLVTAIPVLPGSIGLAEGSMAAALVCSGVHPTDAVAGVLVYRLVSFWLVLPTGWLAWMFLRRRGPRLEEARDDLSVPRALTAA